MTPETLVEAARQLPPANGRRNTDRWLPICAILRGKGYTYSQIHEWLRKQGEDVHPTVSAFAGAMSKRYQHWLHKQIPTQE